MFNPLKSHGKEVEVQSQNSPLPNEISGYDTKLLIQQANQAIEKKTMRRWWNFFLFWKALNSCQTQLWCKDV